MFFEDLPRGGGGEGFCPKEEEEAEQESTSLKRARRSGKGFIFRCCISFPHIHKDNGYWFFYIYDAKSNTLFHIHALFLRRPPVASCRPVAPGRLRGCQAEDEAAAADVLVFGRGGEGGGGGRGQDEALTPKKYLRKNEIYRCYEKDMST